MVRRKGAEKKDRNMIARPQLYSSVLHVTVRCYTLLALQTRVLVLQEYQDLLNPQSHKGIPPRADRKHHFLDRFFNESSNCPSTSSTAGFAHVRYLAWFPRPAREVRKETVEQRWHNDGFGRQK